MVWEGGTTEPPCLDQVHHDSYTFLTSLARICACVITYTATMPLESQDPPSTCKVLSPIDLSCLHNAVLQNVRQTPSVTYSAPQYAHDEPLPFHIP